MWTIGKNKVNQFYYGDTISKLDFPDTYNPTGANQYSFSGLSGPYTAFDGQTAPHPGSGGPRRLQLADAAPQHHVWRHVQVHQDQQQSKSPTSTLSTLGFQGARLMRRPRSSPFVPPTSTTGAQQVAINDYDNLFATALGVVGEISHQLQLTTTKAPRIPQAPAVPSLPLSSKPRHMSATPGR